MKHAYILLILLPFLFACQKDYTFDGVRPDERLSEALSQYEVLLKDAPHGWKGHLYTQEGNGFGFLFNFDGKNRVQMLADIDPTTDTESKESSYRLKAALLPSLFFDTYSYIHLLADPDPGVLGGEPAWGYYSDFEFSIVRQNVDSVFLKGNLNGSKLILVKATAEEATAYRAGNLRTLKEDFITYSNENRFPYIMTKTGDLLAMNFNLSKKKLTLSYDSANQIINKSIGFAFSGLNYLELEKPISYGGTKVQRLALDRNANSLTGLDGSSTVNLFSSSTPLFSFNQMLGVQFQYVLIPFEEEVPGSGTDFNNRRLAVLEAMKQVLPNSSYPYLAVRIDKKEQSLILTLVIELNGQTYIANYGYYYTMNGDTYKFVFEKTMDANAEYLIDAMVPMLQGFVIGDFTFDYHLNNTALMGYGQSSTNPTFKFLGTLE